MDTQKQIVERLKQANNVLITVSTNPSIDQLSAALGLSLALNKLDKHAAAVYSGQTPSTIEFLQPEATFEQTTDSLRDFIISLDKSKADKLRYKVEDEIVRIFITPYRSSITEQDLDFSQGDFNVDVVVALGVHEQRELDQAVTAHGRILHDATVVTMNNNQAAELGTINWLNEQASSLAEMSTEIASQLGKDLLDEQIATALLTGIVSETDRFSNEKTTANTMKLSAVLMAAGANQQLVATKLEVPESVPDPESAPSDDESPENTSETGGDDTAQQDVPQTTINDDGTLRIAHENNQPDQAPEPVEPSEPEVANTPVATLPEDQPQEEPTQELQLPPVPADNQLEDELRLPEEQVLPEIKKDKRTLLSEPQNEQSDTQSQDAGVEFDADGMPKQPTPQAIKNTILSHGDAAQSDTDKEHPAVAPVAPSHTNTAREETAPADISQTAHEQASTAAQTLEDLERKLGSQHVAQESNFYHEELNLDDLTLPEDLQQSFGSNQSLTNARDAVSEAMAGESTPPEPIAALNAQPLGGPLHQDQSAPTVPPPMMPPQPPVNEPQPPTAEQSITMPLPTPVQPTQSQQPPQPANSQNPNSPPPVPPPIMPPFNNGQ